MFRLRKGEYVVSLLCCKYADSVFRTHIYFEYALVKPRGGDRYFINRVFIVKLYIIKYIVRAVFYRKSFGGLFFGLYYVVGTVS